MPIPIRNFPYTDYHDLNLDFLLRQFQAYELDIEELKRRVKALEDWRTNEVDPDIHNIKLDIIDIKGDIVIIKNRLDIVEGNITTLSNNITDYYIIKVNDSTYEVRKGTYNGPLITDFTDFINDLKGSSSSTLGDKSCRLYLYDAPEGLYNCSYCIYDNLLYVRTFGNFSGNRRLVYFDKYNFIVTASTFTVNPNGTGICEGFLNTVGYLNITDEDTFNATDITALSTDYPYYVRKTINNLNVDLNCIIDVYIRDGEYFDQISDYVCEYIRTGHNYIDIFVKSNTLPVADISLQYTITY